MASDLIPISIKVPADKLRAIDAFAKSLGMSRTEYLIAQGTAPEAARALRSYRAIVELGLGLKNLGAIAEREIDALRE